tara:strand:+ start:1260 stop:1736 length:477 start_codon:yes stop_codon:yes gene_type:complete
MVSFERRLNSPVRLRTCRFGLDVRTTRPLYGPLSRGTFARAFLFHASGSLFPDVTFKDLTMSRRCELTGIGPMVGHSVSHSNVKTKRRFLPSLKTVKLASESLGQSFSLRISNAALRTLDYKGGLDAFIVKARDEKLSTAAQRIKRQVKAKLAEQTAA